MDSTWCKLGSPHTITPRIGAVAAISMEIMDAVTSGTQTLVLVTSDVIITSDTV